MAKNEATLEARIDHILSSIFPTFKEVKVEHQKSFSIQFGHHNVQVDLKEPSKYPSRAILDILLTIGGVNTILLELKKEGLKLSQVDIDQGISYARLLHPMPPLTLISNGIDNQFYNTYTKEKIEATNIDFEFIQKLTDNSFQLATNDFKDAVNLLLNNEPELFSQVINQISAKRFERFFGTIDDFTKPICLDFRIDRKVVAEIHTHFSQKAALVGLIGSAFSGKTNLLYEFFTKTKSSKSFILYLDCSDHNYSIFQQLANHFSESSKISINKDKIREWLINSLCNSSDSKFYLLLDNFNNEIPEAIKAEIIELIDIFKGINHHTLYSIDEFNFKEIAFVANRQYKTLIGEQSKIVKLDELDDDEYNETNNLLLNKFQVLIEHGGHYTPEYREPRIVRHLASLLKGDIEAGQFTKVIAVPDYNLLNAISENKTYTRQVHDLYRKIASCFFTEFELRKADADIGIVASGSGAILKETFKKNFPDDYETLIKSSVIVLRELRNGKTVIYPKIQELVAKHSIELVIEIILRDSKEGKPIPEICKTLINYVTPIPYCDIVATGVLMKLAYKGEVNLFSDLVQELINIPPHLEKIGKGTKVLMYSEGIGHIQVNFEDDMDEGGFVSDFLPYAILSQLAGYPLGLVGNKEYSVFAFHLYLLNEVGSNKHFLRRADVRSLNNMKHHEGFDWDGVGYIVSGHEGIIEPIVQSIQKCFMQIPDEIEILYNRAFDENNFNLLYRIYLALRTMMNYTDESLAKKAKDYVKRFNEYFKTFMADFLSKDVQDPKERDALKKRLLSMKTNDKEEKEE
jgi:hypothetical protein